LTTSQAPFATKNFRQPLQRVLDYAHREKFSGFGKHDALNSTLVKTLTFNQKWLRVLAIQAVMRSPINIRPLLGVKKYRNPKGIALFARSYLNLYKVEQRPEYLQEATSLLDWLDEILVKGWSGPCWGYFWDWQDLGFFAPFGSPNCVVTTFVGQALLDGYEITGNARWLELAAGSLNFIRYDLKVLYEDDKMKCISYIPDKNVSMAVMDVSALAGALMARVAHLTQNQALAAEARKLVNFVVDKQTPQGAWYYTHPPEDSPVKIDNYHTGFILDAILDYEMASGDKSFHMAYRRGLDFYKRNLFLENGAPKWMSDKDYPHDIHGAATGVSTFSRAALFENHAYLADSRRIASWAIDNMQAPQGYFYYQKFKHWTTKFTEMRWCNAWMANGLSNLLLAQSLLEVLEK